MNSAISLNWTTTPSLSPNDTLEQLETLLQTAVERFVEELGFAGAAVAVLLADDPTLQELNRDYRDKDTPTDVLSWSYWEEGAPQPWPAGEELGDLAVSLETAQQQATANGWDLKTELLRLLAHGCAHLVGYDHQTPEEEDEMRTMEIRLLKAVGLNDLYEA